jgi:hypothetical protein
MMEVLQLLKFFIKKERPNFMASWAALELEMAGASEPMQNPLKLTSKSKSSQVLESTEDPLSPLLNSSNGVPPVLDGFLGDHFSIEEDENLDELY